MTIKPLLHIIALIVLLFVGTVDCHADIVGNERINYVTRENGLAGESVSSLIFDSQHRVWMGTNNGVSMYNGKRIVSFRFSRGGGSDPNYVYDLCEGDNHSIYAVSGQGVFELRQNDDRFRLILPDIPKAETVLVHNGVLYLGNREGLHIYDGKHMKRIVVGPTPMAIENGVRDIKADNKGNIWFTSRYMLNSYNPTTGKHRSYNIAKKMPERAALSRFDISGDRFYVGTKNNGLYLCLPFKGEVQRVEGVGNIVTSVYANRRGEVCVSCDGQGAFLLDAATARIKETYNTSADQLHNLNSDAVYCYRRTEYGTNWFGLFRYGLAYTFYSQPLFHTYTMGNFTTEGMNVRSFYIGNGEKVIGTTDGVYLIDEHNHKVSHVPSSALAGAHIITNIYYYCGKYYIASYDAGLRVLDPKTLQVSTVASAPLLASTTVSSFATSRNGQLWIGTSEGIYVINPEGRAVAHYTENNSRLCRGSVTGIYFDSRGNGWIGSEGLSLYVAATRTFENANFPDGFFNGQSNLSVSRGHDGMLLFNRLHRVFYSDINMKHFGEIKKPAVVLGSISYAFLDDLKGHYWFATDNGLFRTDYQLNTYQRFGYGEGLRCWFVNVGGVKADTQGNVWIGTSNGLMQADAKAMEHWQKSNEFSIALYDVRKGSDLMTYDIENKINRNCRIFLTWNVLSQKLSFRPVLLDYARQNGRMYQWRLSDNDEWHNVSDETDIEISHLFLGSHSLQLRLAGAEGTATTYSIIVMPSALAIIEFVVLIAAIALLMLWCRYHKNTKILLNERDEIEGALMEAEKAQQNAEMQMQQMAEQQSVAAQAATASAATQSAKYSRVRIDEAECADIVKRMKSYIERTRIFTNPELKMSDIAEELNLSSSRLSQVFSLYMGENYYEFINRYRLEEFKRLIASGEYRRFTLTALSEQCGFKKSSFFSTFRRVEGMTPTEYLKKLNIKL